MSEEKQPICITGLFTRDLHNQVRSGFLPGGKIAMSERLMSMFTELTLNGVLILDRSTWDACRKAVDFSKLTWHHHIVVCGGELFDLPETEAMIVHTPDESYNIVLAAVISGLSRKVIVSGAAQFLRTCERLFDEMIQVTLFTNTHAVSDVGQDIVYNPSRAPHPTQRDQGRVVDAAAEAVVRYEVHHYDLSAEPLPEDQAINITKDQGDEIQGLATALRRAAGEHMIKNAARLEVSKKE